MGSTGGGESTPVRGEPALRGVAIGVGGEFLCAKKLFLIRSALHPSLPEPHTPGNF